MDKSAPGKVPLELPNLPPRRLRRLKGWLSWDFEWEEGDPKPKKMPYYADGGRRVGRQGSRRDRARLVTFEEAYEAARAQGRDGVGLATFKDWGICGLDFDHCRRPDGSLPPIIVEIASQTYAEWSPSGEGVRAFVLGNYGSRKSRTKGAEFGFETFSNTGFVTFTGNMLYESDVLGMDDTVADLDSIVAPLVAERIGTRGLPAEATFDPADPGNFMAKHRKPLVLTDEEVEDYVSRLDPDMSYPDWRDVGFALHHQFGGDLAGLDIWENWSRGGSKHKEGECEYLWEGFGHTERGADPITMKSVIKMANRAESEIDTGALRDASKEAIAHADLSSMASPGEYTGRFRIEVLADMLNDPPLDWWIKGVLPKADLAMIYGQSGSGKTFVALDLGLSLALGRPWQGHRVKQARVLYIAAEGRGGIRSRLEAYCKHHGIPIEAIAQLGILRTSLDITKPEDIEELVAAIAAVGGADIIIIDTLAQTTPGANENTSEDMGAALGGCRTITDTLGSMVMLVHHAGKDISKGARGWSGIRAAVDMEMEVYVPEGQPRLLTLTKLKDGRDGLRWNFRLEEVSLGLDGEGDPVSSCVALFSDAPPPTPEEKASRKVDRLTPEEVHVLEMARADYAGIADAPLDDFVQRCASTLAEPDPGSRDLRARKVSAAIEALAKRKPPKMEVKHGRIIFLEEG